MTDIPGDYIRAFYAFRNRASMCEAFEEEVAKDIARTIEKDLEELEEEELIQEIERAKYRFLNSKFEEIKETSAGKWLQKSVKDFYENEVTTTTVSEICDLFWRRWSPENDDFNLEIEGYWYAQHGEQR